MIQLITKIPFFVFPLFIILLLAGLRARKTSTVPLAILLLIPSVFLIWSLFSFFGKYATNPLAILVWFVCLGAGFFIGFSHMQRLKLQFDKKKKKVEMPGSWIPLTLSMSIFTSKFSIGMMSSIFPHLNGSILFLVVELFATIILGIFAGRGLGCLMRYKASSLDEEKSQCTGEHHKKLCQASRSYHQAWVSGFRHERTGNQRPPSSTGKGI